ncbi:MAG: T9SS type A sorting domain-containing protein [Bacteroidia bacterium]|nr:T9SS type A sorting domain-containing protein [Bacteroidia bacterium]
MFKRLLLLTLTVIAVSAQAQVTILDFEAPATSTRFFYFGSSLDGSTTGPIANPDKSGINTSDSVMVHVKPTGSQVWAGAFTDPNPTTPVDVTAGNQICMKVWMPAAGNVMLKLEQSSNGGTNWEVAKPVTTGGQWVEVCWDPATPSDANPAVTASGFIYNRVVVFFNFGTAGNGDSYYFDDIVVMPVSSTVCNTILDFEAPATSTDFFYFGSSLDGSTTSAIANPDKSGINTSDSVMSHIKPTGSQVWAGAFSDPNPTTPVNLLNGEQICMKVWLPAAGNVMLKLEQSSNGGSNWEVAKPVTTGGQWVEMCWDPNTPSDANPGVVAAGFIYNRIVVFFNFGTAGDGSTYYFDDICVQGPAVPTTSEVTFSLNLNGYTGSGTQPTVNGSFNGFSGTANPLSDADGDNIWTTTVTVPNGLIEYKFAFDNWAVQEEFNGTEECTRRDPSGQFVNRAAVISGDVTIGPVCWNSCYNCGDGAKITINLGFPSGVTPNAEGVYLAGGAEFGAAPNEFRLRDPDGDGVYSLTFERNKNFNGYYTFTNGPCADYSCKEDINGQACANPANFNDRRFAQVTQDTTINTCFGVCSTTTACSAQSVEDKFPTWFTIAPTATGQYAEVSLTDASVRDARLTLLNAAGQTLLSTRMSTSTYQLDLGQAAPGLYLVRIETRDRVGTLRVIRY